MRSCLLFVLVGLLIINPGIAQDTKEDKPIFKLPDLPKLPPRAKTLPLPKIEAAPIPVTLPVFSFRPKNSGTSPQRSAKATRGDKPPVNIYTITPSKSCLTLSTQPSVFWHQDQKGKVQIALNDPARKKTYFSRMTSMPMAAGTHRFSIAETGITLQPGINYVWSVTFIIDEDTPSSNPVARGTIVLVEPDAKLQKQLAGIAPGVQRAQILAEHGIFYDALNDLCVVVKSSPDRADLKTFFEDFIARAGARS